jgi:uncharacterized membrane protein
VSDGTWSKAAAPSGRKPDKEFLNILKRFTIATDVSSWSSFFNVFGVIFAIIAGFLLVTVLSRYSNLNQTIEDELNAVESVRDFLVYES